MILEIITGLLAIITVVLSIWANNSDQAKQYLIKYQKVETRIKELIVIAEKFESLDGQGKKTYVIQMVILYMLDLGIVIPDHIISNLIDELVNLTKKVNI